MNKAGRGWRAFFIIWFGQFVSSLGSQLTAFALSVWVYEQTHSVSSLAITQVAAQVPYVALSPLAGVLADRWNRRTAMIVSDFGAGFAVLMAGCLFLTHHLQVWMVIPINLLMSSFRTLMWPALTAATSLLVPKEQYGRAGGLTQLGGALPAIAGPAIAGMLYASIGPGIMALADFASYLFSVIAMLLFVRIPDTAPALHETEKSSVWREMRYGWEYILARQGLLALLIFYMVFNFLAYLLGPLIAPLILDNWNASTYGFLSTVLAVGMLVGTLVMSAWGGGKRKIYAMLGAFLLDGLFLAAVCLRVSAPLIAVCGFGAMFCGPITQAANQAIWQAKVAPQLQGRVFGFSRTISESIGTIAPLLAAPLADYVFKPAISPGGVLAPVLGPIIGTGASHGAGLMISTVGLLISVSTVIAFCTPSLRRVELDLPDHDAVNEMLSEPLSPGIRV